MSAPIPPNPAVTTRRKTLFGLAEHVWSADLARWQLRPRWKTIVATFSGGIVLGYLSLAGGLYARDRWIRGSTETSYWEMLVFAFPDPIYFTDIRWTPPSIRTRIDAARKAHAKKMATVLFNRAKAAYERRDFASFYQNVLASAQIDPSNNEARLLAANIFLAAHREDDALDTMEQALAVQIDKPDYVGIFLSTCFRQEKEARIIGLAKYFLAKPELSPQMREIFATAMAAAQFYRGEFDECLDTVSRYNLGRTREGFLLNIRILWEKGRRSEAISQLEPAAMSMTNDAPLLEMLIDFKLRNKDTDGARSSASMFLLRAPDKFQGRIKMIEILDVTREPQRRDEEIARYRRDFAGKETELIRLCEFCSDRGRVELCRELMTEAEKKGFAQAPRFRLLFIESHLAAGRYTEAIALVDKMFIDAPEWLESYRVEFDCLRMVAQMSLSRDDMGEIGFRRLSESKTTLRMPLMTVVAKKLIQVGRPDDAMRIIDFAYDRNGRDLTSLASVIEVHLDAGGAPNTPELLRSQLTRRRPSTEILEKARRVVAGDAYLFEPGREKLITDLETLIAGKSILPPVGPKQPIDKIDRR